MDINNIKISMLETNCQDFFDCSSKFSGEDWESAFERNLESAKIMSKACDGTIKDLKKKSKMSYKKVLIRFFLEQKIRISF